MFSITFPTSNLARVWDYLLDALVTKTAPSPCQDQRFQADVRRLAETAPHLLADIGLPQEGHPDHPDEIVPRINGGLQGRYFW